MSLLQVIGSELRQSFVAVTVETWAISIYTVLLVVAVKLLLHKERRQSLISKFMLAAIVILWMLDFILWVIDVHNVVVEMDMTLISNSTDSLEDRYAASGDTTLRLALVEAVIYSYMTLLGDLVVLWRVWIFWRDGREILIMLLPLAVYLASMICACLVSYCAAQSHADLSLGVFADPPFCQHIQLTSYCTQFAIALVSTVLIGIKTLRYSRMMRSLGTSSTGKKSSVYRVMMILIDTGVLYMLFFRSPWALVR
ncbi:hypothetical protein BDW22DRAFT_723975 [Trametopsis cervina]|nr:hypothetical protein BDW22DRAFT_723975 [Trametopsis cervina]